MPINVVTGNGTTLNRAYYRTLLGSAQAVVLASGVASPVATVDAPRYSATGDANFPAPHTTGGAGFTSSASSNISVTTSVITAQTTQTMTSLRAAASITQAAGSRLTTDLLLIPAVITIAGGELAGGSAGKLYIVTGASNSTINSNLVDGVVPTEVAVATPYSLTLGGTNTFTGGLTLLGGTVLGGTTPGVLNASASALGSGVIEGAGGTLNITSTTPVTNTIDVQEGGLTLGSSTVTATFSGPIAGSGPLFINTGTVQLTGNNAGATGALRLAGGAVVLSASSAFSEIDFVSASAVFRVAAGIPTLDISPVISKRGGATITILNTSGADYTLASSFGNASTFIKGGLAGVTADRVILAAANNFNSVTIGTSSPNTSPAGPLRATATNALGWGIVSIVAGDALSTQVGAALELAGDITLNNSLFLVSGYGTGYLGAIRSVSGVNTLAGLVAMQGGAGDGRFGADTGATLVLAAGLTCQTTGQSRVAEFVGGGLTFLCQFVKPFRNGADHPCNRRHHCKHDERQLPVQVKQISEQRDDGQHIF
jgi:hypothetical protein